MLESFIARLRVEPETPLPPEPEKCPSLELLAEAESPASFLEALKKSCPEEALEDSLVYYSQAQRVSGLVRLMHRVHVWEVEYMTAAEFEQVRTEALARLEERKEEKPPAQPDEPPKKMPVKELGIVVATLDDDLLAQKLILGGLLVESLLPEGPDKGLKAGDILLPYKSVYDIAMGTYEGEDGLRMIARMAGRRKLQLRVLRGEEILVLEIGQR